MTCPNIRCRDFFNTPPLDLSKALIITKTRRSSGKTRRNSGLEEGPPAHGPGAQAASLIPSSSIPSIYICLHVHVCIHVQAYIYISSIYICLCVHVCIHVQSYIYLSSIYICLCMHVCINVQSYIYVHMYMYTCACMAYFIIVHDDVHLMREMPLDAPNAHITIG